MGWSPDDGTSLAPRGMRTSSADPSVDSMTTIACLLYPDMTALDAVGPLQVLSGLARCDPSFRVLTVSAEQGVVLASDAGLGLVASHTYRDAAHPDVLIVPGGMRGTLAALADPELTAYVSKAGRAARLVASVCTGSLILGACGLLEGRMATTHWVFRHLLSEFGATPVAQRWVRDGHVVTSAGVSAGIDMAFDLVLELSERATAVRVHQMLEYDPAPPIDASAWEVPAQATNAARCRELILRLMPPSELRDRLVAR
jgi:transcriptional regulator GlxA family with amidase domain